ncbi:MAG TPA: helix-turn-helix domain-containing protein, partial [Thermomonas sp.]|nr:helix-turn-helix domain-containing protein [Thermomonas sp.]
MSTIYDPRYIRLIEHLQKVRKDAGVTQADLAKKLRLDQSAVSKVEGLERRIDIIVVGTGLAGGAA